MGTTSDSDLQTINSSTAVISAERAETDSDWMMLAVVTAGVAEDDAVVGYAAAAAAAVVVTAVVGVVVVVDDADAAVVAAVAVAGAVDSPNSYPTRLVCFDFRNSVSD